MSNRHFGQISGIIIVLIILLSFPFVFRNNVDNQPNGKVLHLPFGVPDTFSYVYIHLIRGQSCTECSVGALYQWERILSMIDRDDIFYGFVVETLPEDSPDNIRDALTRRPFHRHLFIDYSHEFLDNNSWINNKDYGSVNGFLLERSTGRVISIGNPLDDFSFLKKLKHLPQ